MRQSYQYNYRISWKWLLWYFCGIEVQKIPRHFRTTHKNEPDGLRIEAMSDKELQLKEVDKFWLIGDFIITLKDCSVMVN